MRGNIFSTWETNSCGFFTCRKKSSRFRSNSRYHSIRTDLINSLLREQLAAFITSEATLISLANIKKKKKTPTNVKRVRHATFQTRILGERRRCGGSVQIDKSRDRTAAKIAPPPVTPVNFSSSVTGADQMPARHGIEMPACFCQTGEVSKSLRLPADRVKNQT